MEKEYKVSGFSFSEEPDYKEAKRDEETIEYIKANTDLNDLNKALKLYHKLVERKTLKTVVGYTFLKELQERIIKEGIIGRDSIPGIRIDKNIKELKAYSGAFAQGQEQKHLALLQDYKVKLRNSRIISLSLLLIILAMLLISIFSDRSMFTNYESKIIDKYSAWEEELNAREKIIKEKEAAGSIE